MLEALEHAKMQDRFEWLRETSFTGSIFNVDSTVDRAPVDGTHVAHVDIAENVCHTGHIGPLNNVTAGAASATFSGQIRVMAEIVDHGEPGGHWILPDPEAFKPSSVLSRSELALKGTPIPCLARQQASRVEEH